MRDTMSKRVWVRYTRPATVLVEMFVPVDVPDDYEPDAAHAVHGTQANDVLERAESLMLQGEGTEYRTIGGFDFLESATREGIEPSTGCTCEGGEHPDTNFCGICRNTPFEFLV